MNDYKELIDRNELKEEIRYFSTWIMNWNENQEICREVLQEAKKSYLQLVDEQPIVDAEPVIHGHWVRSDYFSDPIQTVEECSLCGELIGRCFSEQLNYCPNCGAKMDEEDHDGKKNEAL